MKDVYLVKNFADGSFYMSGNQWGFVKERATQFEKELAEQTAKRLQEQTTNPKSKFIAVLWKYNEAPAGMTYEFKNPGYNCRCASEYAKICTMSSCPRVYK